MRSAMAGALAMLALAIAAPAGAGDARVKAAARTALARYGEALVTVRLTLKTRLVYEGRERSGGESSLEVAGTLLNPGGLTVISDFSSNPSALFPSELEGPTVDTETSDVKLVLRDGREIPARFVLRDPDLDLAFLVPLEKGPELPSVRFEKGSSPRPLDELVVLYPLGKSLRRVVAVTTTRVRAVVKRPRTFVVLDLLTGLQSLGCPAFDESGRPIGLVVLRRAPTPPSGQNGIRELLDLLNPVVLTTVDLQEVAAQAAAAEQTSR